MTGVETRRTLDFPLGKKLLRNELRIGGEVLEASERILGAFDPETVDIRKRMVSALLRNGDKPGAVLVLRRAMELAEGAFGPEHPETLAAMQRLAIWLIEAGDIEAGLRLFLRKLDVYEGAQGSEEVLKCLQSIVDAGDRLMEADDHLGAADAYAVALKERVRLFGPNHEGIQAIEERIAMLNADDGGIAQVMSRRVPVGSDPGDVDEAERNCRRVLENTTDPTERNSVRAAVDLALLLKSKNEIAEAETIYLTMLDELACGFGPKESSGTLRELNSLLQSEESIRRAETAYRTALDRCGRSLRPDAGSTLRCVNNLSILLCSTGRADEAAELIRFYIGRKHVPEVALRYHLACTECLGGNLETAKQLISMQIRERPHHRARALADPALSQIRDFVKTCPKVPLTIREFR
jgi:tetratricopeptide (TPR) repeat protein